MTVLGLGLLSPPLKSLFFTLACWENPEEGLAVVALPRFVMVEKWRPETTHCLQCPQGHQEWGCGNSKAVILGLQCSSCIPPSTPHSHPGLPSPLSHSTSRALHWLFPYLGCWVLFRKHQ